MEFVVGAIAGALVASFIAASSFGAGWISGAAVKVVLRQPGESLEDYAARLSRIG